MDDFSGWKWAKRCRLNFIYWKIPVGINNDDPQEFKRSTQMHFAQIGEKLADECYKDDLDLWNHEMLSYSSIEMLRAKDALRELVFGFSPPT